MGTIHGSSTMARMNALNGMWWFSSIASHRPSRNLPTVATTVYMIVLVTDIQNTGSSDSEMKLSSPMNWPGWPIVASVSDSHRPRPSG